MGVGMADVMPVQTPAGISVAMESWARGANPEALEGSR